jgi:hypothetical protein
MRWHGVGIVLDLLLEQIDGGLELRIRTGKGCVGRVVDGDIGIDAVALDEPLAVGCVDAGLGRGGDAVVGLLGVEGEPASLRPGPSRASPSLLSGVEVPVVYLLPGPSSYVYFLHRSCASWCTAV